MGYRKGETPLPDTDEIKVTEIEPWDPYLGDPGHIAARYLPVSDIPSFDDWLATQQPGVGIPVAGDPREIQIPLFTAPDGAVTTKRPPHPNARHWRIPEYVPGGDVDERPPGSWDAYLRSIRTRRL